LLTKLFYQAIVVGGHRRTLLTMRMLVQLSISTFCTWASALEMRKWETETKKWD